MSGKKSYQSYLDQLFVPIEIQEKAYNKTDEYLHSDSLRVDIYDSRCVDCEIGFY